MKITARNLSPPYFLSLFFPLLMEKKEEERKKIVSSSSFSFRMEIGGISVF